ncbi:hypothetical protein O6H91_01G135300 [Diphasiastrum complanatum]|uniref:Uncharacterized protein n=1 Tax=Diphasiastrum complanatum TaxID=34168 RepID=A0ACC2EWH1_DIPCM|nr:hypothetical protein O6H91_01G135300 [Diphasiastrum complanatum]
MASSGDSEQAAQNPGSDLPLAGEEQEGQQGSLQNGGQGKEAKLDSAAEEGASAANTFASGGKIFIGGLPRETTTEALTNHFKKYGELTDSVIMKTRGSGHPRGFGFVTFADPSICDRVLQEEQIINGRTVDCKRSIPRENMDALKGPKTKKIFVGGIPTTVTEEEFAKHFSQFGKIVEHQIMLDHSNSRSRGFGFIIFDNEKTVDDLLAKGNMHDFAGKQVEIKKAEPKKAQDPKRAQEPKRPHEPRRVHELGSGDLSGRIGLGSSGLGVYDRYDDGYGLSSDLGYNSGLYRSGYGSRAGSYGGYGGTYGGYGSGGFGGSNLDLAGYGGSYLGGGYGSGLGSYGGSLGGGYRSGLLGGLNDDAYGGGLGYGGAYSGTDYGGSLGSGAGYGGYGSTRGYGGSGIGRYHPYGRM